MLWGRGNPNNHAQDSNGAQGMLTPRLRERHGGLRVMVQKQQNLEYEKDPF